MQPFQVKTADVTSDSFRMLAIPFSGPIPSEDGIGRDTDGEYFSKRTDLALNLFPDRTPLMWRHGFDSEIDISAIGYVDRTTAKMEDDGWWVRIQLDTSHKYHAHIKKLIDQGVVYGSSSAIPWLVKKSASGEILRWPWIEQSLLVDPANTFSVLKEDDITKHYKMAGLDVDALKAAMDAETENALPDSDFALILDDGTRKLPINDADHVRAAISRFDQTDFGSAEAKKKAAKRILARARKLNIDVADDSAVAVTAGKGYHPPRAKAADAEQSYEDRIEDLTTAINGMFGQSVPGLPPTGYAYIRATFPDYVIVTYRSYDEDGEGGDYRINYTTEDDAVRLGEVTPMEQVWVPAKSADAKRFETVPLDIIFDIAIKYARIALARTEDVAKRRLSESRELSPGKQARLKATRDAVGDWFRTYEDLLRAITPPAKASADRLRILELRTRQLSLVKQEIIP